MKTITFYSYKGGVGRTLALANVAKYLVRFGQKVVVMDFDLEAPGLHYKFGISRKNQPNNRLNGVVDIVQHFSTYGDLPNSLEDYVYHVETEGTGSLQLIPAGNAPSVNYWENLASIDWHSLFYSKSISPGIPLFEELRYRIEKTFKPDFLLIDSRTGITEIGGVATTVMPDIVVCLLINNPENLDGVREVLRSIHKAPRPEGRKPIDIMPVVTRIPKNEDTAIEEQLLTHVRESLNQEATDLVDTLNFEKIYILHSDPALQIQEVLTLDTDQKPADSPLLWDYLYLFFHLIHPETIQPNLAILIDVAKSLHERKRTP